MKLKITIVGIFLLCLSIDLAAQTIKAMYVNDFVDIVGDITAEDDLLIQAQANGYNYLILYNLYAIHNTLFSITDPVTAQPLADFIEKARTTYGILQVAGVGETYNSFNNIHDYNLDHAAFPDQQMDHYNIEFEFWNPGSTGPGGYYCTTYLEDLGLPCDTSGAFTFLIDNLCDLHTLTEGFSYIDSEMYIGWPTAGQAKQIADCTDRVLVHYYRSSDVYMTGNSIYNYGSDRLPDLAASSEPSVVMPIFNCQPSYMGPWLDTNPEDQAFDTWMDGLNGYNDAVGTWKDNTVVDGHVWFKYTCMPAATLPIELGYFSVRKLASANLLNWQIEISHNLKEIHVERTTDDNPSHFTKIAIITHPYGHQSIYKDENYEAKTNLYRLKFIYLDGRVDYSQVVSIDNFIEKLTAKWIYSPNASFLNIQSGFNQDAELSIYSANGQLLSSDYIQLHSGNNQITLNTDHWPAGVHLVTIKTNGKSLVVKAMK